MIENKHLKIILALDKHGTLTEAANALCLTQSALSHQIRYLEQKLETTLWERNGRKLRLTHAGILLLNTAQQVLPVISQAEQSIKAMAEGKQGILRIGVECYPCYQWLTGVIGTFLKEMPEVDIDIINKFQFSGLDGLVNQHIDILITPDEEINRKVHYETIAQYEVVLLVANNHPLAKQKYIRPQDLIQETLLSFPVPIERLDILSQFLNPACVKPAQIKPIESIDLMLQMVTLNRGVCVLPIWLAENHITSDRLSAIRIDQHGMHKKLFIALRNSDKSIAYIKKFITIGKQTASSTL